MSGGFFDYNERKIIEIAEDIKDVIQKNGKPIPVNELSYSERNEYNLLKPKYKEYEPAIIEKFEEGLAALKEAYMYAWNIDRFLSGDMSEKTFKENIKNKYAGTDAKF